MALSSLDVPPLVIIVSLLMSAFFLALFYEATTLRRDRPRHPIIRGGSGGSEDEDEYDSFDEALRRATRKAEKMRARHVPIDSNILHQLGYPQIRAQEGGALYQPTPLQPIPFPGAASFAESSRTAALRANEEVLRANQDRLRATAPRNHQLRRQDRDIKTRFARAEDAELQSEKRMERIELQEMVHELQSELEGCRERCGQRISAHLALREMLSDEIEDLQTRVAKLKAELSESKAREEQSRVCETCAESEEKNRWYSEEIEHLNDDLEYARALGHYNIFPRGLARNGRLIKKLEQLARQRYPELAHGDIQVLHQIIPVPQQDAVVNPGQEQGDHDGNGEESWEHVQQDPDWNGEELEPWEEIPPHGHHHVPPPTENEGADEDNDDIGSDNHSLIDFYDAEPEDDIEDNADEHEQQRDSDSDSGNASTTTRWTDCRRCAQTPSPVRTPSPSYVSPERPQPRPLYPATGLQADGNIEGPLQEEVQVQPSSDAFPFVGHIYQAPYATRPFGRMIWLDNPDGTPQFVRFLAPTSWSDFFDLDDIDDDAGVPVRFVEPRAPFSRYRTARRIIDRRRAHVYGGVPVVAGPSRQAYVEDADEEDVPSFPYRTHPHEYAVRHRGNHVGSYTRSIRGGADDNQENKRKCEKHAKRGSPPSRSRSPSPEGGVPLEQPAPAEVPKYRTPQKRDPKAMLASIEVVREELENAKARIEKLEADIGRGRRPSRAHSGRRGSFRLPRGSSRKHLLERDWRSPSPYPRGDGQEHHQQQQEQQQQQGQGKSQHKFLPLRREDPVIAQHQRVGRAGYHHSAPRQTEAGQSRGDDSATVRRGGRRNAVVASSSRVEQEKDGKENEKDKEKMKDTDISQ